MMKIKDKIEIPTSQSIEGYVWMSDATAPQVLQGKFDGLSASSSSNPFVIEAQLYDTVSHKSWSVKHVDGQFVVGEYEDVQPNEQEDTAYVAHRMKGVEALLFKQTWVEEQDATDKSKQLRCGMPMLVPGALIFVGFKKSKNNG